MPTVVPYTKQLLPITLFVLFLFFTALTVNSFRTADSQLFIPDLPVTVAITADTNVNMAVEQAVFQVGEATFAKCHWDEQKLMEGYYNPYAKIDVIVKKDEFVTAQMRVAKSMCPEQIR